MKKKIISIAAAAIVLVLLAAAYFALSKVDAPSENDEKNSTITEYTSLLSIDKDTVTKYSIKTADFEYALIKSNGEWAVEGKEFIRLDSVKADELIKAASVINADDVIESPDSLVSYGLDNPQAEIKIFADSATYDINIGNTAPTQDRYYITFNGDGKVYTVYESSVKEMLQSIDNLRMKNIHNITEEGLKKQDEFVSMVLEKPNGNTVSIRRKNAEELQNDIAANAFVMEKPYYKNINTYTFEQYVFEKIPNLKIIAYVEDAPSDLSKYGLDNSQKTVLIFQTVNEKLEIELGKEDSGTYYAKLPNENSVFTLSANELSVLKLETFKLLDPSVYLAYIGDVESVEFKSGGDSVLFRIEDIDSGYKYYAGEKELEEKEFQAIYHEIISLSFTAPSGGSLSDTADYEYSFKFRDGRVDNVKFVSENERNYAAVVNGKAEFSLDKGQVKTLADKVFQFKN